MREAGKAGHGLVRLYGYASAVPWKRPTAWMRCADFAVVGINLQHGLACADFAAARIGLQHGLARAASVAVGQGLAARSPINEKPDTVGAGLFAW